MLLFIVAPTPRLPLPSEKQYKAILPDGSVSRPKQLPCWHERWRARQETAKLHENSRETLSAIDPPDVLLSVVVPAYNEEGRLHAMLEEAVGYLEEEFSGKQNSGKRPGAVSNGHLKSTATSPSALGESSSTSPGGWEILVVSDGSTDSTVEVALDFARSYRLAEAVPEKEGSLKSKLGGSNSQCHGSMRVVSLETNRGKGGAVTHGMRHVRGRYVIFADADGASKFSDLEDLMRECRRIEDKHGRAMVIGSRAHLVGSEAVVKVSTYSMRFLTKPMLTSVQRSFLRNLLMHGFHLFLRLLTPPATAAIKDTQCGFKLFTRPTLPCIIPYMHSEGWIFDVEMLMLAEAAAIPVTEVAVDWKEVKGSKLNVIWDSLGMAWGLAVLRAAWAFGVYRRR